MCQNRTDSQTPLSGAWAKVQGQATAQLQLSNQSPVICQFGISVMRNSTRLGSALQSCVPLTAAATGIQTGLSGRLITASKITTSRHLQRYKHLRRRARSTARWAQTSPKGPAAREAQSKAHSSGHDEDAGQIR